MRLCPKCNIQYGQGIERCPRCNEDIVETNADARARVSAISLIRVPRRAVIIGLLALAGAFLVAFAAVLVALNISRPEPVAYVKDGNLYVAVPGEEPTCVALDIYKGLNEELLSTVYGRDQLSIVLDRERDLILYPCNFHTEEVREESGNGEYVSVYNNTDFDLMVYDLSGKKTRIAEKVLGFAYCQKTGETVYRSGEGLYSYLVEKEKCEHICDSAYSFDLSEEGNLFCRTDKEYILRSDGKKTVIDTEHITTEPWINDFSYSADYSVITVVTAEGELYRCTAADGNEKIAENVSAVYGVYSTGEVFFSRSEQFFVPFSDYVTDDHKEEANSLDREKAEEIREWLKGDPGSHFYKMKMYVYSDGEEKQLLPEMNTASQWGGLLYTGYDSTDIPILMFQKYSPIEPERIKISDLVRFGDYKNKVWTMQRDAICGETENVIIYKNSVAECAGDAFRDMYYDKEGKRVYFLQGTDSYCANIYGAALSEKGISAPELLFEKVYDVNIQVLSSGELLYFKKYGNHNSSGEMYIGDTLVDKSVYAESAREAEKLSCVLFLSEYERKGKTATLKMYKDGEVIPVAYKVDTESLTYCPDGVLFTASDGEDSVLYFFGGKKIKIVDRNTDFSVG